MVVLVIEFVLFILIPIFVCFAASKIALRKVTRECMSINDFNRDKDYYRDLVDSYSPSVISYIDSFDINLKRDVISILLKLELKNIIRIDDDSIVVLNDGANLTRSESLVLKRIKSNTLNKIDVHELKAETISDCINSNLIIKNPNKVKLNLKMKPIFSEYTFKKLSIFWAIICIPLVFFNKETVDFLNEFVVPNFNIIFPCILIFIAVYMLIRYIKMFRYVYKSTYVSKKNRSFIRTKEGEELNKKIEGLRNFLSDFGNMDSKDKDELIVWEDYLIYACLFGVNNDVIEKLKKFIR